MLQQALIIARKDLFLRFTNRSQLLFMLAVPLAISSIIALVFGNLGGTGGGLALRDVPLGNVNRDGQNYGLSLRDIPLGIVNLDSGAQQQGQPINHGARLVQLLTGSEAGGLAGATNAACPLAADVPANTGSALDELFDARALDDVAAGRALVERGELAALIIVPADFSARLNPRIGPGTATLYPEAPAAIEVYSDVTRPLESLVARSVAQGYGERQLTGNIALGAAINTLIAQQPLAALRFEGSADDEAIAAALACGFSDLAVGVQLVARGIEPGAGPDADEAEPVQVSTYILRLIGTAQATFFALMVAQSGVLSVIQERQTGTLQRVLTTPTTRSSFLAGKLLGIFITVLVQLLLLMCALSLVASLLEGRPLLIWGANLPALFAILLPLSLAVSGIGVLLIAFVQRPEQVGPVGSIINILLAMLGGGFGFSVPEPIARTSLVFWAIDAMAKLGVGNLDVALNALVLALQGALLFGIGLWLFRRRVEV